MTGWLRVQLTHGRKAWTVAQVLEALAGLPREALVRVEGCDCTGLAGGVRLDEGGAVLIRRVDRIERDAFWKEDGG